MANKVNEIKLALGAGARANKYRIDFNVPSLVESGNIGFDAKKFSTLALTASFPSVTTDVIEVWNQGRKLNLYGDTQYDGQWTITLYNNEDHQIRRIVELWRASIDNFQDNKHSGVPEEVMSDMTVVQLDSAGNETASYTFHNVWPTSVGEVAIGGDQSSTIETFDVTFSYSDWVVGKGEFNDPTEAKPATLNASAFTTSAGSTSST